MKLPTKKNKFKGKYCCLCGTKFGNKTPHNKKVTEFLICKYCGLFVCNNCNPDFEQIKRTKYCTNNLCTNAYHISLTYDK